MTPEAWSELWRAMMPSIADANVGDRQSSTAPADAVADFLRAAQPWLTRFFEGLQKAPAPDAGESVADWLGRLAGTSGAVGEGFTLLHEHPIAAGLERVFVRSSDALGLGPATAIRRASIELARAEQAWKQSQRTLFDLYGETWASVTLRIAGRLQTNVAHGSPVGSAMTLLDVWAKAAEEAFHEVLQSERGLEATAAHMRALARRKRARQSLVNIVAAEIGVPTREELDDAYRMINALKREVRTLKKAAGARAAP